MSTMANLDEGLALAHQLSAADKLRLIEGLAPELQRDLQVKREPTHKWLRRLALGAEISKTDIAQARRDMWAGIPRATPSDLETLR